MALSAEEKKLLDEIGKENAEIAKARERVKGLRKQYDTIHNRRTLEHKIGVMSDAERDVLRDMLVKR